MVLGTIECYSSCLASVSVSLSAVSSVVALSRGGLVVTWSLDWTTDLVNCLSSAAGTEVGCPAEALGCDVTAHAGETLLDGMCPLWTPAPEECEGWADTIIVVEGVSH